MYNLHLCELNMYIIWHLPPKATGKAKLETHKIYASYIIKDHTIQFVSRLGLYSRIKTFFIRFKRKLRMQFHCQADTKITENIYYRTTHRTWKVKCKLQPHNNRIYFLNIRQHLPPPPSPPPPHPARITLQSLLSCSGITAIPGGAGGTILGGWIIKRWRLDLDQMLKGYCACAALTLLCAAMFLIQCPNPPFAGVTYPEFVNE